MVTDQICGLYTSMKKYVEIESMSGCELLNYPYKNKNSILRLICNCGRYFETSFSSFKCGKQQCDNCGGRKSPLSKKRVIWTIDMIRQYIEVDSKSSCRLIDINRGGVTATVVLICPQCNSEYSHRFDKFRDWRHYLCNDCVLKNKFNDVKSFVESCGCELISNSYTSCDNYLTYRCSCGNEFSASFNAFKNVGQQKCKECSYAKKMSGYEKFIHEYLTLYNVNFKNEYSYKDCKREVPLRFDFAILNNDSGVVSLIEYDGQQHFEPVRFGGISEKEAKIRLRTQKRNDKIKNTYCKNNNIPLLRIPYWESDNMVQILDEWLS